MEINNSIALSLTKDNFQSNIEAFSALFWEYMCIPPVQKRLVRVLDPSSKSGVGGKVHDISETGLALLASMESK